MYHDKRNINKLFIIVIFVGFRIVICSSDNPDTALPVNDYVLRSCMSSVELTRRNIDVSQSKFPSQRSHGRTANLPLLRASLSRNPVKSYETREPEKSRIKLGQRAKFVSRPARKMIADTPLMTLNLERRVRGDDGPRLFAKKDLLPEVESSKSDGERNENEASIILIESA